jgi:hypothetical protein
MQTIIIVPYRDRAEHLRKFRNAIRGHCRRQRIPIIPIIVAEQVPNTPFNRGAMLNFGAIEANRIYGDNLLLTFHDVDMIPQNHVNYRKECLVRHLAGAASQFGGRLPYPTYVGGVLQVFWALFVEVGGYSWEYKGWGGEDDDFGHRLASKGFEGGLLQRENYKFSSLAHPNTRNEHPDYQRNLERLQSFQTTGIPYDRLEDAAKHEALLKTVHHFTD